MKFLNNFLRSSAVAIILFLAVYVLVVVFHKLGWFGVGLLLFTVLVCIGILIFGITTGISRQIGGSNNRLNQNVNFGLALLIISLFFFATYKLLGLLAHLYWSP